MHKIIMDLYCEVLTMNKKFITICLTVILIFTIFFITLSTSFSTQTKLFCQEEQILFPAPVLPTLGSQSMLRQFVSQYYPLALLGIIFFISICFTKKYWSTLKKWFPKALCVLLCFLFLGSSVSISRSFAENTFTPVSPSDYYGRKQLEKMNNSDALLFAYEQMASGIENLDSEIKIRNIFHSLVKEEWDVVLYTYLYDYPQHFWMATSYKYQYDLGKNGEKIISVILPNYVFSETELKVAREKFNQKTQEILNTLSPSMNEYELELSIHNILCNNIVYQDDTHAHTAYGGLVTGLAVCEGYGKAFQYLLNQVGIESTLATGYGFPPGATTGENHAWNFVKINGNYYYTDVTWDDQSEPFYAYFNITTDMLTEDHFLLESPYAFPKCTALNDNYFTKNNAFLTSYKAEPIINLLKYNLKTHVYITGTAANFNSALLDDSKTILTALDMVTSSSISISSLGRERVITISGHRRGDVNGDNILDDADVSLIRQYLNDTSAITNTNCLKAADYNKDGKIDSNDSIALNNEINETPNNSDTPAPSSIPSSKPEVSSVSSSTPTVSTSPNVSTPASSNPTSSVSSEELTPSQDDPSETVLGDVNNDTSINAKDALVVLKISVGKYEATDTETVSANVNKDDSINAKDALEILKKSVGKPACF